MIRTILNPSSILRLFSSLAVAIAVAVPAVAQNVAFDFDTDDDPGTIENEVSADVGDLVVGYMVLNDFHHDYEYMDGIQFGLELTSGLDMVGWNLVGDRGGMLNDGYIGIAVALGEDVARSDLPQFLIRFVVRVTNTEPQSVKIGPSIGWGNEFDAIIYSLGHEPGQAIAVMSPFTETTQIAAFINGRPTPLKETAWGAIKKLFEDDAL